MNPARKLLQRKSLPLVLLTLLASLLVCLVCELIVGHFLSSKNSWNISKITQLSTLFPVYINSTKKPIASESTECLELKSRQYNMSRAIFSAAVLKNTKKANLRKVSKLYDTDQSFFGMIRKISEQLPFQPLPAVIPGSTCVVVGSSGVLLRFPGLGKVIDSYDYVIRINFAPTSTFESFVGSNTSLQFGYLNSLLKALQNESESRVNNSHILFLGTRLGEYSGVYKMMKKSDKPLYQKFRAVLLNNRVSFLSFYSKNWIMKQLWLKGPISRPTTGIIALIIASHWCPSVPDFAGFGMHLNNTEVPYHYFDNLQRFSTAHNATNEVCGILKLMKCGYIGRDLTFSISDENIKIDNSSIVNSCT